MVRGGKVVLRARRDDDVPILHAELHQNVEAAMRADSRPWRPVPVKDSKFKEAEPADNLQVDTLADNDATMGAAARPRPVGTVSYGH